MGSFSTRMRGTATRLITKLGNSCVLTKVTEGAYIASLGKTETSELDIPTFSASIKKSSDIFSLTGTNTNLIGFNDNKVIVPWIGQEIDTSWKYNGNNIISVEPIKTQDEIIIYTLTIGEK